MSIYADSRGQLLECAGASATTIVFVGKFRRFTLLASAGVYFFINNTTIVFVARRRRIYLMEMMLIKNHMAIFADSK